MKLPVLLLSAWSTTLAVLPAATAPRISQVGNFPGFTINHQSHLVVDADGDGDMDMVALPARFGDTIYSQQAVAGQGLLIENLRARNFAKPRVVYLPVEGGLPFGSVVGDFLSRPGLEVMGHHPDPVDGNWKSRLHIYPLASAGLATEPVRVDFPASTALPMKSAELDGDGVSELLYWETTALVNKSLLVMDRLADGSYGFATPPGSRPNVVPANDFRTCDCDGDGDLDLVFARNNSSPPRTTLILLERTGHRTFGPAREVATNLTDLPEFEDLNGDGLADAYRFVDSTLTWCMNQGGFAFGDMGTRKLVETTDTNAMLAKISSSPAGAALTVVYKQTDNSGFTIGGMLQAVRFGSWVIESNVPITLPPGAMNYLQKVADLDLDGHDDLLWGYVQEPTNISPNTQRYAVCWGGDTGFSAAVVVNPPSALLDFALIRDWDHDGDPDVLAGPDADGCCHLLVNDGNGSFPVQQRLGELDPPQGWPSEARLDNAIAGDVDGDGWDDLVVSYVVSIQNAQKRVTALVKGRGDGSFHAPTLPPGAFDFYLPEAEAPSQLIDFDGDGDTDVINQSTWTENMGGYLDPERHPLVEGALIADIFGNPVILNAPHAGDLDDDGFPDFINTYHYEPPEWPEGGVGNPAFSPLNSILVAYNDGQGCLEAADMVSVTLYGSDVFGNPVPSGRSAVVDVNADGLPDLCTREMSSFDIFGNPVTRDYWRRNPGGGSRSPHAWLKLPLGDGAFPDSPVPTLDFNADGRKDWVSPTGYLRPTASGPVASSGYDFDGDTAVASKLAYLGAADFDCDGDADFLLYNKSQPALFLMRNTVVDERSPIVRSLVTQGVSGGLAGPDNDADGDCRSNFTELLEGTNPLLPDAGDPGRFSLTLASGAVAFSRRADAADLGIVYRIETSGDLVNWGQLDAIGTVQPQESPWDRVTVALPTLGPGKRFFRLAASPQPE